MTVVANKQEEKKWLKLIEKLMRWIMVGHTYERVTERSTNSPNECICMEVVWTYLTTINLFTILQSNYIQCF